MRNVIDSAKGLKPGAVVLLGIPYDENSSFMRGPALAPRRIREVLHAGATNYCSESGLDLATVSGFHDLGDIDIQQESNAIEKIRQAVGKLLKQRVRVLALGGDHAITYPILKAYGRRYRKLNILHLDAHPDLYDHYRGNRYSHACPFARVMEENLAERLVQVGIRTLNPHQRQQAERFGVEVVDMRSWRSDITLDFDGPVYLSVDLDVLDPAFAPGVSHHEPGGFSMREVVGLIQRLEAPLVGADIVEFNPNRDPLDITAMAAVKLLKEIAARMIELSPSGTP
jgi:agmatinase